jgi:hypothetical protein
VGYLRTDICGRDICGRTFADGHLRTKRLKNSILSIFAFTALLENLTVKSYERNKIAKKNFQISLNIEFSLNIDFHKWNKL